MCVESRSWVNCRNRADVNCDPLSVVIVDGTPNIDIQDSTRALATDSDEVSRSGIAEGQRELSCNRNISQRFLGNWTIQSTNEGLDQVFIRSHDPILLYGSIDLFEDELGDNGIAMLNVKIRVMSSGFFVLQRFFLRIDGSLLRVWDTRLQWRVNDKYLLREVKRMDSEKWLPSMVGIDPNEASPFCTRLVEHRFEKLYPGTLM
ncbi:hypothetical protein ACTXT7_002616 [Hymenolepis weldensis]